MSHATQMLYGCLSKYTSTSMGYILVCGLSGKLVHFTTTGKGYGLEVLKHLKEYTKLYEL